MIYVVTHYYPPVSNPPANRMEHLVRLLIDAVLRYNVMFPRPVEYVAGGTFSLAAAAVMFGVLAVGWQLLPFGSPFLAAGDTFGFSRYQEGIQGQGAEQNGFPRTGFPGDHGEPRAELYVQFVHQGEVVHGQVFKHGLTTRRV